MTGGIVYARIRLRHEVRRIPLLFVVLANIADKKDLRKKCSNSINILQNLFSFQFASSVQIIHIKMKIQLYSSSKGSNIMLKYNSVLVAKSLFFSCEN